MKPFVALILFLTLCLFSFAQTSVVTYSNTTRPVPEVGHMLNFQTKPSWGNQSFLDSVKALNPQIVRYPGGTSSQYFDWETGRSVPASLWQNNVLFSYAYIGTTPHVSYPLSELLYFYQQSGIKPVFCLNMLTKTLPNQLQMLQTASSMGIPVEYIELGNELYFEEIDFTNKYPMPSDYVDDIKNNWIPQLSAAFPNARIAVIGGYDGLTNLHGTSLPERIYTWNNAVFSENLNTEAITFHYYFPPTTTTLSNPILVEALAAPFKHWPTLKSNTVDNVTNGMECWITEYNMNDGNQNNYAIASSWAHGLYTASAFSLMLEEPKITMLLNHQIAGSPSFASLASYTNFGDTITNRMTAEGNAMRLLHQAVKGNNIATKLNFSLNPIITVGSTNYPSLLGWVFENGTQKELFILNLSNTAYTLDLTGLWSGNFDFEHMSATDPMQKEISTQDLIISKGSSSSVFQVEPYSLLYAGDSNILRSEDRDFDSFLVVYPNPGKEKITVRKTSADINLQNYQIIDLQGKPVHSGTMSFKENEMVINISRLSAGAYLLKINTANGQSKAVKFLKQ